MELVVKSENPDLPGLAQTPTYTNAAMREIAIQAMQVDALNRIADAFSALETTFGDLCIEHKEVRRTLQDIMRVLR